MGGAGAAPVQSEPGPAEAGYQSDEEDTANPMSYDEKRQVGGSMNFIPFSRDSNSISINVRQSVCKFLINM